MIPNDYLVPVEYPEGDKHLAALNNIQFAHAQSFDLNSLQFFSEATYLIANAIQLFRSGYYDCAFYSLRQSIELSIVILYITERGDEYLRKREMQKDGFETGAMINYLKNNAPIFKDVRTRMTDFFEEVRSMQKEMNKYVHKQGYGTFYTFNRSIFESERKQYWQTQRLIDFDRFVIKCIGAVAVYRLALDPLPVLLREENMLYKIPSILTAPYTDEFIQTYIGRNQIESFYKTQIYQEYYNHLKNKETLCEGCYKLLHLNDYDRTLFPEIISQFHVLPSHTQLAVLIFSISPKIADMICKNGWERYSSDIPSRRIPWSFHLGTEYYESLFPYRENFNQHYNNVYISRIKINNEWEYIEHNEQFTLDEWKKIEKIGYKYEKINAFNDK